MQDAESNLDFRKLFEAMNSPLLVLDVNFNIVAANEARVKATGITLEQAFGRNVFDVFPKNPNDSHADGLENLRASLNRVLKNKVADQMAIQNMIFLVQTLKLESLKKDTGAQLIFQSWTLKATSPILFTVWKM